MKRFRFKFTAVERVRKSRQDEALRSLAAAQSAFQEATALRNKLNEELLQSLIRRETLATESSTRSIGVMAFQLENSFLAGQRVRILQAENAIKRASKNVEKALRGYLQARRQMRMVEVLREKAFAEFKRELNRQDQKATEEIYTNRAHGVGPMASSEENMEETA